MSKVTRFMKKNEKTPNARQMECIKNINGKYLVLAGPGTGKTFTVINRIKYMIENGVLPEKILCLTFSSTAARKMKTKIGDNLDVNVFTYHEFCLNIMEEFPDQFDILNLKVITNSHKRTLIKECIDELKPIAYNNEKNNPYQYSKDILEGIEEIKKNRLSKEDFFTNLKENPMWEKHLNELKEVYAKKETQKVRDEIKSLTQKNAQMNELWQFYELYTMKMRELNYIDFSDMINMVLDRMEDKDSSLLEEIAYKYDYIIVDEYQDTNKAQNDIVFKLSEYCPNIFVVGDDDQIIYTFQGANLDTIENYLNQFPDVRVICLTENNRSPQTILDVSQEIAKLQNDFCRFKASKEKVQYKKSLYESTPIDLRICSMPKFKDLNITKDLISPKTSPAYSKEKPVEYYSFENRQDERDYIVEQIKNIINSSTAPESLSEIAILTRTNAELKDYEIYLKANGIPVEITGGKNIFNINSVNVLITYMQFLTNPEMYSDKLLGYLLLRPFHIDPRDYKTLCDFKSHYSSLTENILNLLDKGISEDELKLKLERLLKASSNTITEDIQLVLDNKSLTIYDKEKLKKFIDTYNYLRNYITNENYTNSLLKIGEKTEIFGYYFNDEINKLENIKGIKKLLDEAEVYFTIHTNQENTFTQFVDYLTKMLEGGIEISLDKEEKPLNAVQLSTYHSSKGREFEYVFMPSLTSSKWESSTSSSKDIIPLKTNCNNYDDIVEKNAQVKFLDNIKLLYVGMTRAKYSLVLSAIENGTKEGKLSWFIKEVLEKLKDKTDLVIFPEKTIVFGIEKPTIDYDYKREFEDFIKSRFQKSYSASSLNTYRKCPKEYFYNYILGLKSSSGSKDNLTYGLAVHKAFQYTLNYAMKYKKYPIAEEAYLVFAKTIDELPCENPDKLKESGKNNIFTKGKYYDKFISIASAENINSVAEMPLKYTTEDGISFNGTIDRIDENPDGTYSIYDYKTGTDNSGITPKGIHSDYYYQIAFYKYLFKKQENVHKNISTYFIYPLLEDNAHIKKEITDNDCETVANEFIECVKNIQELKFDRPNKCPNEKFCNYKNICKMNVI